MDLSNLPHSIFDKPSLDLALRYIQYECLGFGDHHLPHLPARLLRHEEGVSRDELP
jgi:hypothetical protein